MSDLVAVFLRVNLAAGLTILAVIAVRPLLRRRLGAEEAYGLWAIPPVVAAASFLPAPRAASAAPALDAWISAEVSQALLVAWIVGGLLLALWFALRQWRFMWLARLGRAGPAVVGLIAPRLVMPPDDGAYSATEREIMRAHELEHIRRGDLAANAVMAALQCLAWFNPLVHLAARLMRLDQELACDAGVIRASGISRATYARALLKVQLGASAPFAAAWSHPLELRIGQLSRPSRSISMAGPIALTLAGLSAAAIAWIAQPPAVYPDRFDFPAPPAGPSMSVMLIRVPPGERFPS